VLTKTKKQLQDVKEELVAWQCQCNSACQKLDQQKDVASMLKREINRLNEEQKTAMKAIEEASRLRTKLQELRQYVHKEICKLYVVQIAAICVTVAFDNS